MRRKAFTLVEALVAIAIAATLFALLIPGILTAFVAARKNADHAGVAVTVDEPKESWSLLTVKHKGHWWVIGNNWGAHSPDCPCYGKKAEAER